MAAVVPSSKKSNPLQRIQDFHGFSSGTVMVSTTYGPGTRPSRPRVVTGLFHLAGPPLMRSDKARTLIWILENCCSLPMSSLGPFQTPTINWLVGRSDLISAVIRPPSAFNVMPELITVAPVIWPSSSSVATLPSTLPVAPGTSAIRRLSGLLLGLWVISNCRVKMPPPNPGSSRMPEAPTM